MFLFIFMVVGRCSGIKFVKALAEFGFVVGDSLAQNRSRGGAVLKAAFGEEGHFKTGDGLNAGADNLPFEIVKFLTVVLCKFDEGNAFGDFDNLRPSKRTESIEVKMFCRSIGAGVGAAEPSAICERVFDFSHSPTFMVEHWVVKNAADGKFGIFLNGVVFEVFIAAIAVDQMFPVWVAPADGLA